MCGFEIGDIYQAQTEVFLERFDYPAAKKTGGTGEDNVLFI
jgi:hypothetical protein